MINDKHFPRGSSTTYFLATGQDFPDALAGAALAGQLGAPIYVTQKTCMPQKVATSIKSLGASSRVVLGGTGAVSASAAKGAVCKTVKPKLVATVKDPVNPGNYCSVKDTGKIGYTVKNVTMKCTLKSGEKTPRWRAA